MYFERMVNCRGHFRVQTTSAEINVTASELAVAEIRRALYGRTHQDDPQLGGQPSQ
jgi:hypothetical protein